MLHRSRSSEWLIAVLIAVLLAMVIRLYFLRSLPGVRQLHVSHPAGG